MESSVPFTANGLFITFFILRYLRFIIFFFAYWLYKPAPMTSVPKYTSQDVSVILPTASAFADDIAECIRLCLENRPRDLFIVTVGRMVRAQVDYYVTDVANLRTRYPETTITVLCTEKANKRLQVVAAIHQVRTKFTILMDDSVFWGPKLIASVLAAFEADRGVGLVGTNKRVARIPTSSWWQRFVRVVASLYLERHNYELMASNTVDGGVFVISGRTSAMLTSIVQSDIFLERFTNERFFFGMLGPLNADDDNFIARTMTAWGWRIKFQSHPDAMVTTPLRAETWQLLQKMLRWTRTTFRSNPVSLRDPNVWRRHPFSAYAVFLSGLVNLALFWDPFLAFLFRHTTFYLQSEHRQAVSTVLFAWTFLTKCVKIAPFFRRNPQDLVLLPAYFMFVYLHSLIRLYALATFWDIGWGSRRLTTVEG
ncbi:Nucleotide-diphospho-sugar transferase [Pleurostoma richardsiae]|uniref:Nucleotide-diphospho-sugar transferase n=1 Tax=Pleurostoma richardsiae TaxID=41990 RepID=A0AA38VQN0_9PEZI|nr:Nucleotide-diphospho-sugar transferase [Pleurostoma richardsiae]